MNLPQLARKTLEVYFKNPSKQFEPDDATKKKYSKEQACFVTLTKSGDLRGCIGSLEAHQILWKDVQERAVDAAVNDPRFLPLSQDELKKIKIEVSILSVPKKLEFKSPDDLLNKLNRKMGLILQKGIYSSTFLPQVWEEISGKKEFLEHLSMKAGLSKDSWKTSEFWFYTVDAEKEK